MTYQIENKFEYPLLTKAYQPLNYFTLKVIKDELKSNAVNIHLYLGRGVDGHLGLVLSATEYANISALSYVRHVNPLVSFHILEEELIFHIP